MRAGGGSARGRLPDRGARFVARSRALRVSRRARAPRGVPFLLSSSPPPAAASLPLFLPPRWRRCSRSAASPPKLFPALRSAPRRYRPLPPSYEKKRKKKRARRGREGGTRGRRLFCLKPPTFRPFLLIRRGALREKSRRERAGGARGGGLRAVLRAVLRAPRRCRFLGSLRMELWCDRGFCSWCEVWLSG